jgi:RNA polymerase sigma-70 factor (ECF subfamily)
MEPNVTDAEAIRGSQTHPAVFVVVYERHCDVVFRFLRRRVGDELAEDLAAEAWARAFRQRSRFRPEHETALPWLFGICSNLIADHRRAERRRLRALEQLAGARVREHVDGPADGLSELAPELVRALRRLPSADRDALLLVAWGELSYEETAVALGVPIGTVRSRVSRARRRLAGPAERQPVVMTGESHA